MAKKLGYGGVANTNGARDFSGKAVVVAPKVEGHRIDYRLEGNPHHYRDRKTEPFYLRPETMPLNYRDQT